MTPLRTEFVTSSVCASLGLDARAARPLEGVKILDVGCGGGILAEALAKRGARVTGVDVVEESLGVARAHAAEDERVRDRVAYYAASIEQVGAAVDAGRQRGQDGLGSAASVGFSDARPLPPAMLPFDAVVASEVMEHVENLPTFAAALSASAAPQAPVVVTTLNRTLPSYLAAIVLAERVLRWVPRGTHRWERFLTPEELAMLMRAHGRMRMEGATGMLLDPLAKTWRFGTDLSINYAAHFVKMV